MAERRDELRPTEPRPARASAAAGAGDTRPRGWPLWRRRLLRAATERIGYKAAALFFALVLWLAVGAEEPAERVIPVRFEPALDSSLQLQGRLPAVQAQVTGRLRELIKLYSNPPVIHRVVRADAPDTTRLELDPGDVDLQGVTARVVDVYPREVTLRFASTVTRLVPVRSALHVVADSAGRVSTVPELEPDSVVVVGRRDAVRRVASVPTVDTTIVADTLARFVLLDTSKLGVRVRTRYVRVRFPARPVRPADAASERTPAGRAADSAREARSTVRAEPRRDTARGALAPAARPRSRP